MRHWELTTGAMPMGAPGWPELDLKVVSTCRDCQCVLLMVLKELWCYCV